VPGGGGSFDDPSRPQAMTGVPFGNNWISGKMETLISATAPQQQRLPSASRLHRDNRFVILYRWRRWESIAGKKQPKGRHASVTKGNPAYKRMIQNGNDRPRKSVAVFRHPDGNDCRRLSKGFDKIDSHKPDTNPPDQWQLRMLSHTLSMVI
jgi:hypothetical protein